MTRLVPFCLAIALVLAFHCPAAATPPMSQAPLAGHLGGSSLAVAVQGSFAFVGQSAEFAVIDMLDGTQPRRLAYLPVAANDIVLRDGYAYVTNAKGLAAIDVRRPEQPVEVAFAPASSALGSLAVAGNYIYAGAPGSGLFVFDISTPAQPQPVTGLGRVQVEGLAAQDGYLYLATAGGMQLVSIADPRRPVVAALWRTPAPVESVAIAGGYVYLALAPGALLVADIADPAEPRLLSYLSIPTYVKNLQVTGNLVYLANGNRGVAVVDVTDRTAPRLLEVYKVGSLVTDVAVAGDQLLATDVYEGGLHVLAVQAEGRLAAAGVYRTPGMTQRVAADDHYAYLAAGSQGDITVADTADPLNPMGLGFFSTPEPIVDISVHGDWLYAYSRHAVQVLNISDRTQPVAASAYEWGQNARVVAVHELIAFVDDGHGLICVYDVSVPGAPQPVGMLASSTPIYDATVVDGLVLAAAGREGVLVVPRSLPGQPALAQPLALVGSAVHVAASGDAGYVMTAAGDLYTLDLRTPTAPAVAGKLALGVQSLAMVLHGVRLYIAAGEAGVYVVDVSAPVTGSAADAAHGRVYVFDTPGVALDVAVAGGQLLVADSYAGLLLHGEEGVGGPAAR